MTMQNTAQEPNCVSSRRNLHGLVQAIRLSNHLLAVLALSACVLTIPSEARAQVNPEIANCAELKDEATVTQADLCSAHIGCRFVLNVQKTCARAKGYLERLQTAIGEGTRTFFGSYRKEVTPDAVFTATLGGEDYGHARKLGGLAQSQQQAEEIGARVRDAGNGDTKTGRNANGRDWIYYGQVRDDKRDGTGTLMFSSGEIQRGQFKGGELSGAGEALFANGSRYVGNYMEGKREGLHVFRSGKTERGTDWSNDTFIGDQVNVDGTQFKGRIDKGVRVSGRAYRADGTLAEEGRYENGKLSVGTQYDVAGIRTEVNLPEVARKAQADRIALELARAAAEIESDKQRKREEAARAEQQFRSSLQTMNAGQLFARADELSAKGDSARAREVQRALMSRFPSHPLAATVARQMTGESGANSTPPDNGGSSRKAASPVASTGTGLRPIWPSDMEAGNIYFIVEEDEWSEEDAPIMVSALSGQEAVARVQAARAKDRNLRPTTFKLLAGRECIGPAWGAVVTLSRKPWGAACASTPAAAIEGAFIACRQQNPQGRSCEPGFSLVLALSGSTSWSSRSTAEGWHGRFGSYNAQTSMEQYTKEPIDSMQQALSGFDKACNDGRPCYKTSSNMECVYQNVSSAMVEKCLDRKLTPAGLSGSIRSRLP